jgi:hypothetical protein
MDTVLYKEKQLFPLVIIFTLALLTLFTVSNAVEGEFLRVFTRIPFYLVLALFVSPFVFWGIMQTEVTAGGLVIRFGLFSAKKLSIDTSAIRAVEPAVIKWPRDFRWVGITHTKGRTVSGCFVRYGKGVSLRTDDGTVFIGSTRADQLAAALRELKKKNK